MFPMGCLLINAMSLEVFVHSLVNLNGMGNVTGHEICKFHAECNFYGREILFFHACYGENLAVVDDTVEASVINKLLTGIDVVCT